MDERATRARVGDHPRADDEREWEVFVRPATEEAMTHAGSVTAPSADIAHEQATRLFGWDADDVWCCPAEAVRRYSTHDLDDDAELAPVGDDAPDERRTRE